jgi:hypothetical protein
MAPRASRLFRRPGKQRTLNGADQYLGLVPKGRDGDGPLQQWEEEIPRVMVLSRRQRFVECSAKNESYLADYSVNRQHNQDRIIP